METSDKIKYNIRITPIDKKEKEYTIEIVTPNLEWSMDQFQRNRAPLSWKVV